MMVTFVCECEKKALDRTRRVLDAFANRIGSRTWQTVITEEGLDAVKKLLRKTASKNTAVSCHWIRSRSRSDLLWVVGSQNKFNPQGIVPVNYTNQIDALKMDEIDVNIENYYANTKKQPLDQHLFAVGYTAYRIIQKFELNDGDKLAQAVFVAGCWHDMGKVDFGFQDWLAKELKKGILDLDIPESGQHDDKKSTNYPRHNEISLLLFYLLNKQKFPNSNIKKYAEHSIYWHHDKWFRGIERNGEHKSFSLDMVYNKLLETKNVKTMFEVTRALTNQINIISESYMDDDSMLIDKSYSVAQEEKLNNIEKEMLPKYKSYLEKLIVNKYQDNIKENAKNNLARTAVITADRLISSLSSEALARHLEEKTLDNLIESAFIKESGLSRAIQDCLDGFEKKYPNSERNQQQAKAVTDLAKEEVNVGVLNGAAGCGKTKIALEWAAKTSVKKIIWVCPRVQVCQGLFHDLTTPDYLPNAKIEINTGEFKQIAQFGNKPEDTPTGQEFSGDIVITTIDQITNAIITHRSVTSLVAYMNAHVVFDEYHEYINMPAFNLLFAELVECKKLQNNAKALLVSATPNYYFVEELLGLKNIIGIESFNQSQYQIKFTYFDEAKQDESNPLYQPHPKNTFVISNTAITAQQSFIANQRDENAILFHGKFKKSDKQELFNKVFECFKESGNHQYDLLRSGPIVQASLNISCDKMVTEFTHAENWLQRLGRLDRFGKNTELNLYITAIPETLANGKQTGKCARFLNSLHCLQSAKAWYEFLKSELIEDNPVTINQLYKLYQRFYKNNTHLAAIEEDLKKALNKSIGVINRKVLDPVSFPHKKQPQDAKVRIKKQSLRGDNRFVQMAVWNIDNDKEEFPNEYAYDENDEFECETKNLTLEVSLIEGRDFSGEKNPNKDLLSIMFKNHYKILSDKMGKAITKPRSLFEYKKESLTADNPIYVSYTPEDLRRLNGNDRNPCPYAIYYAEGKNQPIGAISNNNSEGENDE
jgi:CRISPR-associated endonuclease/helicase Cas3